MNRALRSAATAIAVAFFLGMLEVVRTLLTRIVEGNPIGTDAILRHLLPMWVTLVIVSPWCAVMARRHPIRSGHLAQTLAAHLGGTAVFVALHLALLLVVQGAFGHLRVAPSAPALVHTYFFYILLEASLYVGIVIVLLLLDAARESAERAVSAAQLEQNLAAARLESLQAQIRPHFLFNTLNALAVLARRGDGAAVDRAIGDLGELLRASFAEPGRHEIPLGDELAFLERYVSLQRIRFPDRLAVAWDVADAARGALVPALLVQPLVENAIEHGLATVRGGHVRVSARRDGDDLVIEVADDGPGFADGGGAAAATAADERGGVGLANTRERLALLHGARGTLTCGTRPGGGGLVTIRLPWRAAP